MEKHAKEHPILFSGPLVRAILDGRKTQTRRLLRVQPDFSQLLYPSRQSKRSRAYDGEAHFRRGVVADFAPWKVGDRLWVRETWAALGNEDGLPVNDKDEIVEWGPGVACIYRADTKPGEYGADVLPDEGQWFGKWRPSIHMPRWASRIDLEVTEVRVQRIQDISEEDARAEGVHEHPAAKIMLDAKSTHVGAFLMAWNAINGARPGGSWEANPWVWAVSFKRLNGGGNV